eukprot:TRINITY_DN26183_c0_g1_i1.p1 TRINITY_DN26183_c0_g1~~TRINITY_DN26183_c0_g1_i1.p1  ORF type:complete len:732 (-),score=170.80 TRINITY_DN26183_c0_g1_i1:674-2869(-)
MSGEWQRRKAPLYKCGVNEYFRRELGLTSPTSFMRTAGGSEDLVKRLKLFKKLDGHDGCVNTVSFTPSGEFLLSGSDDRQIVIWDWQTGAQKLSYESGHHDNVFQARALPFSNNRTIVTCAADGQVRVGVLPEGSKEVETEKLAQHGGRAHKLAIEPGSATCFYSCGEDGRVRHFDLRNRRCCRQVRLFTARPLPSSSSAGSRAIREDSSKVTGLNAIIVNPRRPHLLCVAGSDPFARVYDRRKLSERGKRGAEPVELWCPPHLTKDNNVHITCVAYSEQEELLVSYNEEDIYLFATNPSDSPSLHLAEDLDPNEPRCGNMTGGSAENKQQDNQKEKDEEKLEKRKEKDEAEEEEESILGSRQFRDKPFASNSLGSKGKATETSDVDEGEGKGPEGKPVLEKFTGHRNQKTVKGVSFFGPNSEYVVSGSDCGRIFIWKKRGGQLMAMLPGDSQVVNCLEPHPWTTVLATSGIESSVKIWAPTADRILPLPPDAQKVMERNHNRSQRRLLHRFDFLPDDLLAILIHQHVQARRGGYSPLLARAMPADEEDEADEDSDEELEEADSDEVDEEEEEDEEEDEEEWHTGSDEEDGEEEMANGSVEGEGEGEGEGKDAEEEEAEEENGGDRVNGDGGQGGVRGAFREIEWRERGLGLERGLGPEGLGGGRREEGDERSVEKWLEGGEDGGEGEMEGEGGGGRMGDGVREIESPGLGGDQVRRRLSFKRRLLNCRVT